MGEPRVEVTVDLCLACEAIHAHDATTCKPYGKREVILALTGRDALVMDWARKKLAVGDRYAEYRGEKVNHGIMGPRWFAYTEAEAALREAEQALRAFDASTPSVEGQHDG